MGKDSRHVGQKPGRFEDGYELFKSKKLTSYDRNKNRKQNKFNLNQLDLIVEEEFVDGLVEESEE